MKIEIATLTRLKLHEKRDFYSKLFNKIGSDTKTLWSVMNSLIKKVSNRKDVIELNVSGQKISEPSKVCDVMNDHFVNVGNRLLTDTVTNTPAKDPLTYVKRVEQNLLLGRITEAEISRFVLKMKPKHSCGCDGISNDLLRKIIHTIKAPLCYVLNQSLISGLFPEDMKIAKVVCLFKSGDPTSETDFTVAGFI